VVPCGGCWTEDRLIFIMQNRSFVFGELWVLRILIDCQRDRNIYQLQYTELLFDSCKGKGIPQ